MNIGEIVESAVKMGAELARGELRKKGWDVPDDVFELAVRAITGLWKVPIEVNAKALEIIDERTHDVEPG